MDNLDKKILIEISGDMDISKDMFKNIAEEFNISQKELLDRLNTMKEKGYIKRIAPIIRHYKTSYICNAMTVWNVSEDKKEQLIELMLDIEGISHIYERETNEKWKYNIFGMAHGKKESDIKDIVNKLSTATGVKDFKLLYTERKFKKTSPDIGYILK
ncbi:siroheme decarboxylase subunit beta [Clostridiisalibacter paucivorans]|uniref:siroheme decarboxylase subunit beta n=1 Tax=Clostridiisalibacter paucivorans TaxID=408753 RepID=UPI000479EEC8|nr:winged helix-turn-helix transcriptional regulator [Clostridiisalibacter paucivorans]